MQPKKAAAYLLLSKAPAPSTMRSVLARLNVHVEVNGVRTSF